MQMEAISKKSVILQESAILFRERGFGKSSMRDIAEQVGMEAASLYNHIESKDAILFAICQEVAQAYLNELTAIEKMPISCIEKIKLIISSQIKMVRTNPAGVAVVNQDWKYLSEEKRKSFFIQRRNYEARVEKIIQEGINNQEFRKLNAKVAMMTLLSSLRWIEYAAKVTYVEEFAQIELEITDMLLGGFTK